MFDPATDVGWTYSEVKHTYEASCTKSDNAYTYFNHIERLLLEEGCHTPVPII